MNTMNMDATATYNDSLFMQAVSLPDLLRPIFLDDSMRDAASKLSENAVEMKSIANVTQNLVRRVEKMTNISVSAETQAKLQKAIAESRELSIKIAKTSRDLRGVKFAITWQVNKIVKSAKKTKRNVEKIHSLLSPYFIADPYLIALINENHALPKPTGTLLTQSDIDRLDDPASEQQAINGLNELLLDARVIH